MRREKKNFKNGKLTSETSKAHDVLSNYLICMGVTY